VNRAVVVHEDLCQVGSELARRLVAMKFNVGMHDNRNRRAMHRVNSLLVTRNNLARPSATPRQAPVRLALRLG
jgi:hypothetical protein